MLMKVVPSLLRNYWRFRWTAPNKVQVNIQRKEKKELVQAKKIDHEKQQKRAEKKVNDKVKADAAEVEKK